MKQVEVGTTMMRYLILLAALFGAIGIVSRYSDAIKEWRNPVEYWDAQVKEKEGTLALAMEFHVECQAELKKSLDERKTAATHMPEGAARDRIMKDYDSEVQASEKICPNFAAAMDLARLRLDEARAKRTARGKVQ